MDNPPAGDGAAPAGASARGAAVDFHSIAKFYGRTIALDAFSQSFAAGCVHALLGANGSGKSTVMKILAAAVQPSAGHLRLDGILHSFGGPGAARRAGIAMVHQDLSLVPDLPVAENIGLGAPLLRSRFGMLLIDRRRMEARAQAILGELGGGIPIEAPVRRLSAGQRQIVEIAKALAAEPRVLILDEPSAALAEDETARIFAAIRRLRSSGVTVFWVTHRLCELESLADTVTVLRDGRFAGSGALRALDRETLIDWMFGSPAHQPTALARPRQAGACLLSVRGLGRKGAFEAVHLDLRAGEVVGLAGLSGAGRRALLRAIAGVERAESGTVTLDGLARLRRDAVTARRHGLALLPGDRVQEGLVADHAVHDNLLMGGFGRITRRGFTSRRRERPAVADLVGRMEIGANDPRRDVASLSGGNQQKVLLGNRLGTGPKVLLLEDPTRGIDLAARSRVHAILRREAEQGRALLLTSDDFEELLTICDRILVMHAGRITAECAAGTVSLHDLYRFCVSGEES
jgi:ABC-type sugar transport system ATPase subunit